MPAGPPKNVGASNSPHRSGSHILSVAQKNGISVDENKPGSRDLDNRPDGQSGETYGLATRIKSMSGVYALSLKRRI